MRNMIVTTLILYLPFHNLTSQKWDYLLPYQFGCQLKPTEGLYSINSNGDDTFNVNKKTVKFKELELDNVWHTYHCTVDLIVYCKKFIWIQNKE